MYYNQQSSVLTWYDFEPVGQDKYMIYMYSKALLFNETSISTVQKCFDLDEQNQSKIKLFLQIRGFPMSREII